tara:strand:- start:1401 stop:1556 length:156 start_codon:yes stop_codon:yes gene_type:complete
MYDHFATYYDFFFRTSDPPVYLKPGDVLEMEITGIGILRNTVIDETEVHLY